MVHITGPLSDSISKVRFNSNFLSGNIKDLSILPGGTPVKYNVRASNGVWNHKDLGSTLEPAT